MSKLAVDGGTPVHDTGKRPWPAWPPSNEESWKQIEGEFRGVYLSRTEGLPNPRGLRMIEAFCEYLGAKHGVLTTSGTSALKLALGGVTGTDGLGDNGECIVPQYTFIASATAALEMGFSVRFVDVDPDTACMDPKALEAAITDRTRVIMPVDILGCPANLDPIVEIARKHKLKVVEDACQAHGAAYKGRKCGSLGDAGCFSFQSTKNLTCGEGGFVATNSPEVYAQAVALQNVGRPPGGQFGDEQRVGYNYRPSEYLAVLLEHRLKELDARCEIRNRAAAFLTQGLKGITGLQPWRKPDYITNHAWHLYPMRYNASGFGGRSRDEFLRALQGEGVPCSPGYTAPLSEHAGIVAARKKHPELVSEMPSPNTERICAETVWLTQNMLLADEQDLADIIEAVRKIQKAFHA